MAKVKVLDDDDWETDLFEVSAEQFCAREEWVVLHLKKARWRSSACRA